MVKKHEHATYEVGSENVFADLDMLDAEEKLAKAKLAIKINQLIKHRGLKQAQAAKILDIDQAKVSLLHRGRLSGFSIERLIRYLKLLGQDIEITIKPHKKKSATHLQVFYAEAP